jgi:hypothetical protein
MKDFKKNLTYVNRGMYIHITKHYNKQRLNVTF